MYSADSNSKSSPTEPLKTPEALWKELEPHVREQALRILSDLCYAYITTAEVDSPLDNNDSEVDLGDQERITSNVS